MEHVTFKDAVYASTATPGIFSEAIINDEFKFIDGGEGDELFSNNNPTKSLIAEAIQQGYSLENINVISLGTGDIDIPENADNE